MSTTPDQVRRRAVLGVTLAVALMLWQHVIDSLRQGHFNTPLQHIQGALLDFMLCVPVAVTAAWLADLAVRRTRRDERPSAAHAAAMSLFCVPLLVPLGQVQPMVHGLFVDVNAAGHHGAAAPSALWYALTAQPVVFGVALLAPVVAEARRRARYRARRRIRL